jgi:hypothetical protein
MPRRSSVRKRRPRRVPRERTHAVHANLNVPELTKAGSSLDLSIYARGEKIGEMELGRGGVYWRGGKRHKWKRFSWSRFAEIMDGVVYED